MPTEAPTRRQRRKAEVRTRLYKAALHLFKTQGYESTTVQQICDLADTARATFFNYFPTKEHVLASYHDEMTRQMIASLTQLSATRVEWLILNALQIFADWVESDKAMGRILLRTMFGSDVLILTDQANEKRLYAWFRKQLQEGVQTGEFISDLDVDLLCSMLLGTLSTTVQSWILAEKKIKLHTVLKDRITFLFRAARAEPDRKLEASLWRRKKS